MKLATICMLLVSLAFVSNCDTARKSNSTSSTSTQMAYDDTRRSAGTSADLGLAKQDAAAPFAKPQEAITQHVSLNQADQSQSMAEAMNRKIIRNADLTLEVAAPAEAQRKITSIAESVGGFVVTSESKQRQTADAKQELEINLVVRVPATQFGAALDQIRSAGSRVIQEKVSGQDVLRRARKMQLGREPQPESQSE